MKINPLFFFIGLWAGLVGVVHAGGESGEVATQTQLDALNAENALLTVQLKNIELKEKIKHGGQNNSAIPLLPASYDKRWGGLTAQSGARVMLISGEPEHPVATILLDGAQMKVRAGQIIPGLGTVKSVALDEVLIQTKQSLMNIPFVADPYSAPTGFGGMGDMNGNGTNHVPLPPLFNDHLNGSHALSGLGED